MESIGIEYVERNVIEGWRLIEGLIEGLTLLALCCCDLPTLVKPERPRAPVANMIVVEYG